MPLRSPLFPFYISIYTQTLPPQHPLTALPLPAHPAPPSRVLPPQLLAVELWDIWCFLSISIARQLQLEALTINAPPPPLMYPLPGGVIIDNHLRDRRNRLETHGFSLEGNSRRFSMKNMMSNVSFFKSSVAFPSPGSTLFWKKTPLWLVKGHRLVGHAALGLVNDYIFHQPTIVFVWVFISLIFSHFVLWYNYAIPPDDLTKDYAAAAASIFGWLFLVRGERALASHARC